MRISKIILFSILVSAFVLPSFFLLAEEENLEEVCQWEEIKEKPENFSDEEYEALLKKCQTYYQEKSEEIKKDITKTEQEKETLQSKISSLSKKIKDLGYQIYLSNLTIKDLGLQIKDTEESIERTTLKLEENKERLAALLRTIYEEERRPLIEVLLSEGISDFFDDLVALETLNVKNQELLENIKSLKSYLEDQKQSLDEEKEDTERMLVIQTFQKQESAKTKEEQEWLFNQTEAEYQQHLKEKEETEKKAADIRAKILELIGTLEKVSYEEALKIAKYAASQTGIRPALLLGVVSQESAIGKNVGQCFLSDPETGEGVRVTTGEKVSGLMKPSRDIAPFLEITKELGRDPYSTPVSCPMSFGWGGAMGPYQFIPSTWVKCGYQKRVEEITQRAADPWNFSDASLAASLYLKDGLNQYGTEGKAVQSYFCGYPKNTYWCRWYEENVLYLTKCHQSFIDTGSMSLECQEAVGLK